MTHTSKVSPPLVLVVDDDVTIRFLACEALEYAGFAIEEAESGKEALTAFERLRPSIVLLDVMMPEMDGFETCVKLRQLPGGDRTPVILLTGLDDEESIGRAYTVGATDFMIKPFNEVILVNRMRYILKASRTLQELWDSQARLDNAQRIAHLGNWEWNSETNELSGSDEFYRVLGLGHRAALPLDSFLHCVEPDDRESVRNAFDEAVHGGLPVDLRQRIISPNGTQRIVHLQSEAVVEVGGKTVNITGTIQDISELQRFEEKIHFLAHYDSLTRLPNRALFRDRVDQALAYAKRHGTNVATMFLDLDRFKRVNETLGHQVGDMLLQQVAERLRNTVRDSDSVSRIGGEMGTMARLGGDEFTVLLTGMTHSEHAAKVAKCILQVLARPFHLGEHEVTVTGSLGIACYPEDGKDVDELLKHADIAMYSAKAGGKNAYRFYSRTMNATAFQNLVLENDLRKALEAREFVVYYQPRVDVPSGQIVGMEALLRWQHRVMGLTSPDVFLHVADEAGFTDSIDEWVLREACTQNVAWQAEGLSKTVVSVNVSNSWFRKRDLAESIERILRETGMDPQYLELELTEGIIVKQEDVAARTARELKALGLKLSVDDFGTGCSSLSHLRRFPIDILKIDRLFIRDLMSNEDDAAITKATIAMAHNLKLRVVAEGVETTEQLAFLQEHKCDEVQGFLFSAARSAKEMTELLEERPSLHSCVDAVVV